MPENPKPAPDETAVPAVATEPATDGTLPPEFGGSKLPLEPTRYGDWERNGRCYDF